MITIKGPINYGNLQRETASQLSNQIESVERQKSRFIRVRNELWQQVRELEGRIEGINRAIELLDDDG